MDDNTINLVSEKISAIEMAEQLFKKAIAEKDEEIKKTILKWLSELNISNEKIDKITNKKLLLSLNAALKKKINKKTIRPAVVALLKNFDKVEYYTKKILEDNNDFDLKNYDLSFEKKEAINDITSALLNDAVLNANVLQPLRKIAFRHVTTGISFKAAQAEFEKVLGADPLLRYARTLTTEAILRYDGMINQKIATDFNLTAFRIVGSLIKTSANVCINMINETGDFAGMAINGKYPMDALPQIIKIVSNAPGAVAGLDESNYFIYRNHWGCRHTFIPTRLTDKDRAARTDPDRAKADMTGLTATTNENKFIPDEILKMNKDMDLDLNMEAFDLLSKNTSVLHNNDDSAYYDPTKEEVNIPTNREKESTKLVIYHEFGHVVDSHIGLRNREDFKDLFSKYRKKYNDDLDYKTLKKLDNKLESLYLAADGKGQDFKKRQILSVADTFKSLNINFGAGHSDAYFDRDGKSEAEFIAHMFEAKYQGNPYFKRYFPELYKDMLEFKLATQ